VTATDEPDEAEQEDGAQVAVVVGAVASGVTVNGVAPDVPVLFDAVTPKLPLAVVDDVHEYVVENGEEESGPPPVIPAIEGNVIEVAPVLAAATENDPLAPWR
jgi:hypothetical protein